MNGRREMKGLGTDVQALVGRGFGSLGGVEIL